MSKTRRCNLDGQPIDPADQEVLDDFAAFLRDPSSRCSICLQPGHCAPECPEVVAS